MKFHILITTLILLYCNAGAQPTLTAATSNPVIGEQYFNRYCKTAGVPVGAPGAGITWNYSALADTAFDTVSIVSCASTPYCDSFAGSTSVVVHQPTGYYWAFHTDADEWDYTGSYFPTPPTFSYHHKPYRLLKYPLTYADTWHDTSYYSVYSNYQHTFVSQYHTADGYGTLITPAGTFTNAIRVNVTNYYADTHSHSTPFVQHHRIEEYFWYQPGIHHPLLRIHKYIDSSTGAESIQQVVFGSLTAPTAVPSVPENEDISIFPNPATDVLHIQLPPACKSAEIILMDMTGKAVAGSSGKDLPHRRLSLSGLPPGIYMAQIRSGQFTATKKVIISR